MPFPIDAVVSWVDGNDPAHQKKMQPYLSDENRRADDIAGKTRYASEGEIYYCVASILRFAPFVRKIFIITDNQYPEGLKEFIEKNFPDTRTKVEIIDHRVVFRDFEPYLPTFNATTIETVLFRIPDLSEHFVYFNDDFFLLKEVQLEDWYKEDKSVARGWWNNLILGDFLSLIKPRKNGKRPLGFKDMMRETAHFLGYKTRYFHIQHTPHPLKKSVFERFYSQHPEILESNIQYRVRDRRQIHPQTLYYLLGFQSDDCVMLPEKAFYMKPVKRGKHYVPGKIRYFEKHHPSMVCIGSIDMATQDDKDEIFAWLRKVLNIEMNLK
ncbi:MAG: Stealth CR1 domain-containing protein [Dysgonamonadaceae bacterium]|nr:Stealth CR1 domain-containing protein [Dysgonamonadaceae bacterium]